MLAPLLLAVLSHPHKTTWGKSSAQLRHAHTHPLVSAAYGDELAVYSASEKNRRIEALIMQAEEDEATPATTPFLHVPHCEDKYRFCKKTYVDGTANVKSASLLAAEVVDDKGFDGAPGILGILNPGIDVRTMMDQIFATFGGFLLSFTIGLDVRTTFGIGLYWQNLKHEYSTGDEMERGRPKTIHAEGVIGAVEFVANAASGAHGFTGLFRENWNGIVRFSSAKGIERGGRFFGQSFVAPGMGLKALVDGKESIDLVAMWHLDGQKGQWNFFHHPFATVVAGTLETSVKAVARHFEDASKCPSHVGLLDFAKHGVATAAKAVAPYALVFDATAEVKALIDANIKSPLPHRCHSDCTWRADSKANLAASCAEGQCADIIKQLQLIPSGTVLFNVFAISSPAVSAWRFDEYDRFEPWTDQQKKEKLKDGIHKIGTLKLASGLRASQFGDKQLFFKHQLFEDSVVHQICHPNKEDDQTTFDYWFSHIRTDMETPTRTRPSCGNAKDSALSAFEKDHKARKEFVCRLFYRAFAMEMPTQCLRTIADVWNQGKLFPSAPAVDLSHVTQFPLPSQGAPDFVSLCDADERPNTKAHIENTKWRQFKSFLPGSYKYEEFTWNCPAAMVEKLPANVPNSDGSCTGNFEV